MSLFLRNTAICLTIIALFNACDTVTKPDILLNTGKPLPTIMHVPVGGSAVLDLTIAVNSAAQVSIAKNARRGLLNFEEGRFIRYSTQSPYFANGEDAFILKIDGVETTIKVKYITPNSADISCDMGAFLDKINTDKNTPISINVLENDTFCNRADLASFHVLTQPKHGEIKVQGTTLTFTPEKDFVGEDKVIYTISGRSFTQDNSVAEVIFTVKNGDFCQNTVNSDFFKWIPPPLSINAVLDVLSNDELCKSPKITLFIDAQPQFGNAKIDKNRIIYTLNPNTNKPTIDAFKYGIKDSLNKTIGTANITLTAICSLQLNDDSAEFNANSGAYFSYRILDNDTICNANVNNLAIIKTPVNGTANYQTSGIIFYTPNPNFKGLDSFRYSLTDEIGTIFSASAKIKVN